VREPRKLSENRLNHWPGETIIKILNYVYSKSARGTQAIFRPISPNFRSLAITSAGDVPAIVIHRRLEEFADSHL
jgi:hypothetical protein